MDVQPFQVPVGDVGGRVGDDRKPFAPVVAARLLPAHVVGLFRADLAVVAREREHPVRLVGVDVDFGFAFGTGEHQRIAERRYRFPELAPVDVGAGDDTFGAKTIPRCAVAARGHDRRLGDKTRQVGFCRDPAVPQVLGHAGDQGDETLGAGIDDTGFF